MATPEDAAASALAADAASMPDAPLDVDQETKTLMHDVSQSAPRNSLWSSSYSRTKPVDTCSLIFNIGLCKNDELLAKVVENANLALEIDPDNDKALYRGGKALLLTGDVDGAKEKLIKAAKHRPTDRNIREIMATLKQKLEEQKKDEKERWGGRLLDEKDTTGESKDAGKSQQQQKLVKKPSESNALWMFAIVLIGIALALGQLSFVE
ncbi:unnamed protein product [Phytophthora fragariaefolia]|uniref:Unnamed protein product n=1 Tax=Phytophthora fragariaefolia TaxID=1490495 RepID=A0A9W6YE09_9STRA|nr:unnamed protein product [Phytophthora fragariaefolia]